MTTSSLPSSNHSQKDTIDTRIPPKIWRLWEPKTGDRRQELVFVGIGLDRAGLEKELDGMLLDSGLEKGTR